MATHALDSSWQCPFCGLYSVLNADSMESQEHHLALTNSEGSICIVSRFVVCANPACRKFTLGVSLRESIRPMGTTQAYWSPGGVKEEWQLIPSSSARGFPSYIPKPIREDYEEACAILNLSPKAAASLTRRCLQGMIRDFWQVNEKRLLDEITAIKERVEPTVWDAIEAVRKVGNIGAHMEKDVNLILDVQPEEAKSLIWLIEYLFEEWYLLREERKARLLELKEISDAKDRMKEAGGRHRGAVLEPTGVLPKQEEEAVDAEASDVQ